MAFILQNWNMDTGSANIYAPITFNYITTTDTISTVTAANYFSQVAYSLAVGNAIYAVCSNGVVQLEVTAVNTAVNPATVSVATIISGGQGVLAIATGTLTQSNWTTMFTTPVNLLPAIAANSAIIVDSVDLNYHFATAAFTGGGVIVLQYGSTANGAGTLAVQNTISATFSTEAASTVTSVLGNSTLLVPTTVTSTATTTTSGIYISNQTAVFAAGNAASTIAWTIRYHVITTS